MPCKYGSQSASGSPATTWISDRDLLGCNGQPDEPWYCELVIDMPNILNFKVTADWCALPQPIDPGYPNFGDVVQGQLINMLKQKAESIAWGNLCQCKPPPPPPPGSKDFPVSIPLKEDCTGEAGFTWYRDFTKGQDGDQRGIFHSGISPKGVVVTTNSLGRKDFKADIGYQIMQVAGDMTDIYPVTRTYIGQRIEGSDLGEYGIETFTYSFVYNPLNLEGSSLRLKTSARSPVGFFYNFLNLCDTPSKEPPKEPPPGVPPPPNVCCAGAPPDLSVIYKRLAELEALIASLPKPPLIGSSSIEDAHRSFGVYLRPGENLP